MKTWEMIKEMQEGSTKKYINKSWSDDNWVTCIDGKIINYRNVLYNDFILEDLNYEWEELNELTKDQLRDGMIVEDCDGDRGIVIGNKIFSIEGAIYWNLDHMDFDLRDNHYGDKKIIKIITLDKIKKGL